MAVCGIAFNAASDCRGFLRVRTERPLKRLKQFKAPCGASPPRRAYLPFQTRCFSDGKTATESGLREDSVPRPDSEEEFDLRDLGSVMRFRLSDFSICNHVSIGLAGRVILARFHLC